MDHNPATDATHSSLKRHPSNPTTYITSSTNAVLARASQLYDTVLPASQRQTLRTRLTTFSTHRPLLTVFLAVNLVLSGPPILTFLLAVTGAVCGILTAVCAIALLVAGTLVFWTVCIALLLLAPVLGVTLCVGAGLWVAAVVVYAARMRLGKRSSSRISHEGGREGSMGDGIDVREHAWWMDAKEKRDEDKQF